MDSKKLQELERFIDLKLTEISKRLPEAVHNDPASFACGYNMGYKSALLDMEAELLGGRVDELL